MDLARSWYVGHGTHGTWTEPPVETHRHNMSQRKDLGVPKVRRRGLHGDRVRSCPPHNGLFDSWFDVTGCHRMSQHLVNEHQRVGGLSLLQALDDLAGHGSNLDFTMSSINPCTSSPAQVGACDFLVENEGCIN